MEFNPHALNQILTRIREQTRCPQCGTKIAVNFPSMKLASDEYILLQLRCDSCTSYVVLHVCIVVQSQSQPQHTEPAWDAKLNASSTLSLSEEEMETLRAALKSADGSFEKLFALSPLTPSPSPEGRGETSL